MFRADINIVDYIEFGEPSGDDGRYTEDDFRRCSVHMFEHVGRLEFVKNGIVVHSVELTSKKRKRSKAN